MKEKNKVLNIAVMVVCVILFIVLFKIQGQFARNGQQALNGIIAELQVLLSTIIVVTNHKRGFITALILNFLNIAMVLRNVITGRASGASLPAIAIGLVTIVIIIVIYTYMSRSEKMHADLTASYNQLIESNRLMQEKDAALTKLAYTDRMTGLPNSAAFNEKLQDRVNAGAPFTVIYMDADSFKQINDTFGHAVGDTLIKAYAERFEKYCAGHFDCAKVGGDEFALIIDGIRTEGELYNMSEELRTLFGEPINIDGTNFSITMSYGVSSFPNDGAAPDQLINAADTALYNAKIGGKNRLTFFSEQTAQ